MAPLFFARNLFLDPDVAIFDQDTTPRGDPATCYYYHEGHPSTAVHRHVGTEVSREFRAALGRARHG